MPSLRLHGKLWAPRINVWGGNSLTNGVDCSGLVQQVYGQLGIDLPRVTYDQINVGSSVPVNKLRVGDLVFFDTDASRKGPDHVGIYLGKGKFIHAPRPGESVKISSLGDSYYMDRWMGGRRVPGVAGGKGTADTSAAPILESTELAERYGMSYALFDSEPELKKLLSQATAGQWTTERFQAELKNSKWWRTNSQSVREAKALAAGDPATWRATIEAQRVALREAAVQAGAILTNKQLDKLARDSIAYAWNEAQIANFLGKYIKFREDKTLGGQAGTIAQELSSLAHDLGIRISEQTLKNYAQYVIRGVSTMQDAENQLRAEAAGTYPGFEEQILAGESVRAMAEPYVQMMASELELPDSDLNLNTTLIRDALNRRNGKGQPSPMSLTDFQVALRDDPRWGRTSTAQNEMAAIGRQVLSDLGLVGSGG